MASVSHVAGWGVVAVMGTTVSDEDGLTATREIAELCGPVITNPSDQHFIGATLGKYATGIFGDNKLIR